MKDEWISIGNGNYVTKSEYDKAMKMFEPPPPLFIHTTVIPEYSIPKKKVQR